MKDRQVEEASEIKASEADFTAITTMTGYTADIVIVPLGQPAVQAWALGYTGMRHVQAAACDAPWHQA